MEKSKFNNPFFEKLRETDKQFLIKMSNNYNLSYSQILILSDQGCDLKLWQEKPLSSFWPEEIQDSKIEGKKLTKALVNKTLENIEKLRKAPTDYSDFKKPEIKNPKTFSICHLDPDTKIFGRCPCPPENNPLRCCNLTTLDAVQQCSFGCSYCSIQSFYSKNEIRFVDNLEQKLLSLELDDKIWHLGTGQSSDSLLYANTENVLTALEKFAKKNPKKVIELKTKSSRTDWLKTVNFPRNVIATWSINAPTIIENEELLTANLDQRLNAARKTADSGLLVGFHFHPMVWFKNWKEEYKMAVDKILKLFTPEEVIVISMGTLTFPKAVIKRLRNSFRSSKVLQMQFTPIAGKYSYPLSVKEEMFSFLYSCFPENWKNKVFFYICMEDPILWKKCLNFEYKDNDEFEMAMKNSYLTKINNS